MKFTTQRIKDLKQVFKQIDKDNSELLDKDGLDEALTELGYKHVDLDKALKLVDRQQEGYVLFDDFKDIVIDLESKGQGENGQSFNHAFKLLSDPKLGGITLARLQQLAKAQGHGWTQHDLEDMMRLGDRDHDGFINLDDFTHIWKHAGF